MKPGNHVKAMVDLNKAIESTVVVARNEWKYVAERQTNLDSSLPPVLCLVGEFNQVVLNLIINATHAIADTVKDSAPPVLIFNPGLHSVVLYSRIAFSP
jgi:nitrogen-specific signal transduction histidine kinase